jgi:segregation and condensation protein B
VSDQSKDPHQTIPEIESVGDYSTTEGQGPESNTHLSLPARLEALLFVATSPVSLNELAEAMQVSQREVRQALEALELSCQTRGIKLQRHRARVQLTTSPEVSMDVERFLNLESSQKLTRASLEALSIIAYQQPVTRPEIDAIRGVNSDSVLKTLLRLGLIEETGRTDSPGRPILYGSTPEFLQHFGLGSLKDLPPLNLPFDDEAGQGDPEKKTPDMDELEP